MPKKLSKMQLELLLEISERSRSVASYYRPALALVDKGLAVWRSIGFGTYLEITDAGRRALAGKGGGDADRN